MTPEQRAAAGDTELLFLKRRGRPPGSKDARPRKRRRSPTPQPPTSPLSTSLLSRLLSLPTPFPPSLSSNFKTDFPT